MNKSNFQLLSVDFEAGTGVAIVRSHGAKVCAKFHQLTKSHIYYLRTVTDLKIGGEKLGQHLLDKNFRGGKWV